MEWLFGIPPLTQRDAKANTIKGVVPLSAAEAPEPREDCPETLDRPAVSQPETPALTAEERAAIALEPVPERSTLMGFLGVLWKTDSNLSATPEEPTPAG